MAGRTSLPREVFILHYDRLQEAITSPLRLSGKLLTKHLIGTGTNSKVIDVDAVPSSTKAAWILEDVRVNLETSNQPSTVLKTFCDVLDYSGAPALKGIAASIRTSLDEACARVDVQSQPDTQDNPSGKLVSATKAKEEVTILRSELVEKEFIQLRGDYMNTLDAVEALICERVTLEKLKERIGRQYTYLKKEVERALTMDKVMSLFHEEHDTFPRIVELRGLVHGLKLYEAEKEIDKFDEKRKEVYKTILAEVFPKIEQKVNKRSQNVQVKFVTMWSPHETTVHHFEEFLRIFFASICQEITLIGVYRSSLIFVCSTPFSATGAIINIVKKEQKLLLELGLISIIVGNDIVFKDDNKALALMSPSEMLSRLLLSKAAEDSAEIDSEQEQKRLQEDLVTGVASMTKASQILVKQIEVKPDLQPVSEKAIVLPHEELQSNEALDKGKASQFTEDTKAQQQSYSSGSFTGSQRILTIDDLLIVMDELRSFEKENWKKLGRELGLSAALLGEVNADYNREGVSECLAEMLKHWLNMNYDDSESKPPTWSNLADAMKKTGNRALAKTIREHYSS